MGKCRIFQSFYHTSCKSAGSAAIPVRNKMYPFRDHILCESIPIIYEKNLRTFFYVHSGNPLKISYDFFFTAAGADHYCQIDFLQSFHFCLNCYISKISTLFQAFHRNPENFGVLRIRYFKSHCPLFISRQTFFLTVHNSSLSICMAQTYTAASAHRNLYMQPV